ncbi:MAG: transglycosylase SLT domain-containing protein [Bradyrhizobium sp.]|uniref:transglycosylase SLT domain-containing protein n=1 Tax=Bradyrhizobium sp. TaxID=376 RepID=UPI00272F47A0|nr:transglycosylase SLT domain-containing protein [Bradyrhizobium sp.]MDP1867017.1 transglycosylase SLT domain-containing protein [Bradyrhizobium sp.]
MLRLILAAVLLCAAVPAHADIRSMVTSAALSAGVPEAIAHAVIRQESNYQPHLRGRAGEWGLGQIKCATARGVGFRGGCAGLRDPATNLRFSMAYLRLALNKGGQGCAGVSLYQRGIYGPVNCSGYGKRVMRRAGW